ncbi:MAG TPA: diguanylate cyclase [Piscinibacter sp.]|nr:diguanylate cyclase [Piscinibacter sp.]HPG80378.1 diguanylate cyclase [Piscinibacter sp.]HPM67075.1 diguanylate cyclase [Piscinibacter sp.]
MSTRWASLTDWLLGTEPQQRVRAARCGLACALMLYSIASMGYFVWVGMAPAWPVAALALVGLGGMVACFAVIRSGANLRLADPSLTGVQMSFALIVGAVAYTLAGRGRGAVFPIMMVVLMFGLYSLKPREVRLMSLLALLLFGGAMALMAWISPAIYRPEVEFAHFLVIAIMLPAVSMLAGQLSRLRDRLRRQKAELQEALARIQDLALRDELTGLANRRHMQGLIDLERERCVRTGGSFCLAVIDIDRFKRINDTHGHPAGDAVLRDFAREALSCLRGGDVLARWGGEEFLLMLPDTRLTLARLGVERLRTRAAALTVLHEGTPLVFTLSAGVVEHLAGESVVDSIARADRALYQAKQQGRNKVVSG